MGESPKAEISVYSSELESFSVETPGGRIHIRWDHEASVTPNAQLAFFAEFLSTAGVYESWIDSCPLRYANSSGGDQHKRDALSCPSSPVTIAMRTSQRYAVTVSARRFWA